jgi:hypothetical protein
MNPYLNIKPSGSPTLLSYNGTRQGVDFWNDPQTPTLLVILVFILLIIVVLCYGIKEKYFPNTCWVSTHPTELANRIIRTPVRVEPRPTRPTIEQLTRKVDLLTNVLIELVQEDENNIYNDELKKHDNELKRDDNETKTESSETILDNV